MVRQKIVFVRQNSLTDRGPSAPRLKKSDRKKPASSVKKTPRPRALGLARPSLVAPILRVRLSVCFSVSYQFWSPASLLNRVPNKVCKLSYIHRSIGISIDKLINQWSFGCRVTSVDFSWEDLIKMKRWRCSWSSRGHDKARFRGHSWWLSLEGAVQEIARHGDRRGIIKPPPLGFIAAGEGLVRQEYQVELDGGQIW
jgi:hypothetical protein